MTSAAPSTSTIDPERFTEKRRPGRLWSLLASEAPSPSTLTALRRRHLEVFDEGLTARQLSNAMENLRKRRLAIPATKIRGVWKALFPLGEIGERHRDFERAVTPQDYEDLLRDSDF